MLALRPLTPVIGTEVCGVDLARYRNRALMGGATWQEKADRPR